MLVSSKRHILKIFSIVFLMCILFLLFVSTYLDICEKANDSEYAMYVKSNLNQKVNPTFRLVEIGDRNKLAETFVTIVTIYFEAKKSKHSREKYNNWIVKMIKSLRTDTPLVAFLDEKSSNFFIQKCQQAQLTAVFFIAESIWHVVKKVEQIRNRTYMDEYLLKQKKMDQEKNLHHQDLYAIWNMKIHLVNQAAQQNPFNSTFFLFTDSGAWRNKQKFTNWPEISFVKEIASRINDKMLYGQVDVSKKAFSVTHDVIQATFFAGSAKAIKAIYEDYFALHDDMLDNGLFVGKEQNLMNILTFYKSSKKIVKLKAHHLDCSIWYDKWFFYQYYFAKQDDYICNENKFSILLN
jgi:hypothetical protein